MTISRELNTTLVDASTRNVGNLKIPRVLSRLEKIIFASGALLQEINKSFLDNSNLDYFSKRWLSGKEPKSCLDILQQMANLTRVDAPEETVNLDGGGHYDEPCHLPSEDKINDAITLFNEQQSHFRFLVAVGAG